MTIACNPKVRIHGRSFDLTADAPVRHLLISPQGRRAIEGWLNTHKESPDYERVYSVVSGLTEESRLAESVVTTAAIAACLTSPALSLSQAERMPFQTVCRTCHVLDTKAAKGVQAKALPAGKKSARGHEYQRSASIIRSDLKELTFVNLGSRGSGVKSIGGVYEVEGGATGRVGAMRLLFRDEQGMRLLCEFGKYPPRGSEVVFGNKAYRMWKNGLQWNMRNVVSINGIPAGGNVFIAEYFVKGRPSGETAIQAKSHEQNLKEKKARVSEIARAYIQGERKARHVETAQDDRKPAADEKAAAENVLPKAPERIEKQAEEESGTRAQAGGEAQKQPVPAKEESVAGDASRETKPEYAYYQPKVPEGFAPRESKEIGKIFDDRVTTREREGIYELTLYFGGLTVTHAFKGDLDDTLHEVYLNAYPKISVRETIPVPLAEVKKNASKYVRGIDGQIETDILMLVNNELASLFRNDVARQFPAPDGRLVTGVKIVGTEDYFKYIYVRLYFGFEREQWVALNDEFLMKTLQSEPVPSYMAITTNRQ